MIGLSYIYIVFADLQRINPKPHHQIIPCSHPPPDRVRVFECVPDPDMQLHATY